MIGILIALTASSWLTACLSPSAPETVSASNVSDAVISNSKPVISEFSSTSETPEASDEASDK